MSRNPAKKMMVAPRKNFPTAKLAAAPKFTTSPRKVKKLGLIPVAAIAPTILSSSHLLPVPIAPVRVAIFCWDGALLLPTRASAIVTQPCSHPQTSDFAGRLGILICPGVLLYRFFYIDVRASKNYSPKKES